MLEIDKDGLDEMDTRLLEALIHKFDGGPVGLNSLAVSVGEESGTLEEVHEPYLIMEGFLKRTPQGRVAAKRAYDKLGLKPTGSQRSFFDQTAGRNACKPGFAVFFLAWPSLPAVFPAITFIQPDPNLFSHQGIGLIPRNPRISIDQKIWNWRSLRFQRFSGGFLRENRSSLLINWRRMVLR